MIGVLVEFRYCPVLLGCEQIVLLLISVIIVVNVVVNVVVSMNRSAFRSQRVESVGFFLVDKD